ncbi:MAG TPA: phospholipase D-like domain-containing protein [Vicinamibacteria bacterium]
MESLLFLVIQWVAIAFLGLMLFLALFEPPLPYRLSPVEWSALSSPEFRRTLAALAGGEVHDGNRVEVLTNAAAYYEAELEAISQARHHINLEAYIFQKGRVTRRFVDALVERARAGVQVRLVLDAVGCFATWDSYFDELKAAGGQFAFYHPIRLHTLPRINNRTHRELIVIDGVVGFLGGSGFADHWAYPHGRGDRKPAWRDTMFRVEGPVVGDLQSVFVENWLESAGELLADPAFFPPGSPLGTSLAFVVGSSPTTGGSTRARMLFQGLLAAARKSIHITSPYFLPDASATTELVRAVERGVEVKVITPGRHTDHLLTQRSSRRLFGPLLRAGATIFEYEPAMIHAKTMVVDGCWSVVGSTNFDNRSFGINDEVNLVAFDPRLAERLEEDFARDLAQSRRVTYRKWYRRPIFERVHEWLGALLERQQ